MIGGACTATLALMRRLLTSAALSLAVVLLLGAAVGVDAATNNISTVAGTGTAGFAGDGGAATSAQLNTPVGVAATADGGFLIADTDNERVRKVDIADVLALGKLPSSEPSRGSISSESSA